MLKMSVRVRLGLRENITRSYRYAELIWHFVLILKKGDTMDNSNGGAFGAAGGMLLFLVALCFPFVLLGIGIMAVVTALIPGLFKRRAKVQKGETVVVYHYKPSAPE